MLPDRSTRRPQKATVEEFDDARRDYGARWTAARHGISSAGMFCRQCDSGRALLHQHSRPDAELRAALLWPGKGILRSGRTGSPGSRGARDRRREQPHVGRDRRYLSRRQRFFRRAARRSDQSYFSDARPADPRADREPVGKFTG